jgi:hypothetical protein
MSIISIQTIKLRFTYKQRQPNQHHLCHQQTRAQNQTAQQKGNVKRRDNNTGTASSLQEQCADTWDSNTTSSHKTHPPPTPQGIYTRTNQDLNLHGNNFETNDLTYPRARKQQQ